MIQAILLTTMSSRDANSPRRSSRLVRMEKTSSTWLSQDELDVVELHGLLRCRVRPQHLAPAAMPAGDYAPR